MRVREESGIVVLVMVLLQRVASEEATESEN